ncbi:asparagine synthase C-terminal domain-containing protein [Sorangium sp. So ce269]
MRQQLLLDRKDRMSMATGLEVRVPFCDHRLVEYVFNAPWAMKTFDGREKSLLRAAADDLLPRSVLERRKSPYPATQDPAYAQALRGQLARLLAQRDAPVLPLLDVARARAVAADSDGPADEVSRSSMEQALLLNDWLARYEVRLAL